MVPKNIKKKSKLSYDKMYLSINNSNIELNRINKTVINSILQLNKSNYISKYNDKLLIENTFFYHKVDNVYRYSIVIKNSSFALDKLNSNNSSIFANSNYNDQPITIDSDLKSIIILLESPHKDEFDSSFNGIAPAQGVTGAYIEKFISNIIEEIYKSNRSKIPDGKYRILIVNPIPCQTSLYNLHNKSLSGSWKNLRNKVWCALWEYDQHYKQNLVSTLKELNPVIIINACTSPIKGDVMHPFLVENFSSYILYQTNHPSSWYSKINLKKIKS